MSEEVVKYTKSFLNRLEDLFSETDYLLRYEKGNFKSGYCILQDKKVAIINKYYPLDGKVNSLIEILKNISVDKTNLSDKNLELLHKIVSTQNTL